MIGTLKDVLNDMKSGIYDFTKDGECSGCGQCCTALLPVSEKELRRLHRYVDKKHIKPVKNLYPASTMFDITCPFCDNSKEKDKCLVYQYRPEICRKFKCDLPSNAEKDKNRFHSIYRVVDFREEFR